MSLNLRIATANGSGSSWIITAIAVSGVTIRSAGFSMIICVYILIAASMPASSNLMSCFTLPCSSRTVSGLFAGTVHVTCDRPRPTAINASAMPAGAAMRTRASPARGSASGDGRAAASACTTSAANSASTHAIPYTPATGAKPANGPSTCG